MLSDWSSIEPISQTAALVAGSEVVVASRVLNERLVLPEVSAQIDLNTGRLMGTAPPGSRGWIATHDLGWPSLGTLLVDRTGSYTAPVGVVDTPPDPEPGIAVFLLHPSGIWPVATAIPCGWRIDIGKACIAGGDAPDRASGVAHLLTTRPLTVTTAPVNVFGFRRFSVCFSDPILPGERLRVNWSTGSQIEVTIPQVTIGYDPAHAVIEGQGMDRAGCARALITHTHTWGLVTASGGGDDA